MQDIEHYGIQIYNFPFDPEEDDDELIAQNSELRVSLTLQLMSGFISHWKSNLLKSA